MQQAGKRRQNCGAFPGAISVARNLPLFWLPTLPDRDPCACVLAYVERYHDDILQLEQEWELLYAVLLQCWRQEEYSSVIHLVAGLAPIAGRLSNQGEAEHMLHLGIRACHYCQDREHLAFFLNRLGSLLFSYGKYQQGRRLWHASLQFARASGYPPHLWQPLSTFASITDMLGIITNPRQYEETYLLIQRTEDPDTLAVLAFVRGLYARLEHDLDCAYEHFRSCLRQLALQPPASPPSAHRQLFRLAVQTELARVQGDYARSQAYAGRALSLAYLFSDRYTAAALLMDQGLFTYRQGQFADSYLAYQQLYNLARQIMLPHISRCCRFLAQHLSPFSLADNPAHSTRPDLLSERELEVLQLVAEGLANREIAHRLVVTPGTVKKHLEHIYIKLDAHSRTSAISRARTLHILT